MISTVETSVMMKSGTSPGTSASLEEFLPSDLMGDVGISVTESRQLNAYFAWLREQNLF